MNTNIQEWYYAHDADITFGEVHISKAPKIILAIVILFMLSAITLGIMYRDTIYDFIANPQLVLTTNAIEIDVYSEFNPNTYISNVNIGEYEITDINSMVDTSTLGTYKVIYSSKNSIKSLEQSLIVTVKDITAPVILLKTRENSNLKIDFVDDRYIAEVILGDEKLNNFDPSNYIDVVIDNYSSSDDIELEWSRKLDFSKAGLVTVIYSAIDTSGNKGITSLNIAVVESFDEDRQAYEDKIAEMEAELEQLKNQQNQSKPENNNQNNNNNNDNNDNSNDSSNDNNNDTSNENNNSDANSNSNSNSNSNTNNNENNNENSNSTETSLTVVDCSVPIDVGIQGIFIEAAKYVKCSGGNAQPIGGTLMTTQAKPGKTYTLIWECNGIQATQNITITE